MCSKRLNKAVKYCSIEGNLDVREVEPYKFMLLSDLIFRVGKYVIRVPKGFLTDFASVPKKLRSIVPSYGYHTKAAVLHDYLYSKVSQEPFSKDLSDDLFYVFMTLLKTPKTHKNLMYTGVSMFGSLYYKEKDRKDLFIVEKTALVDRREERKEYEEVINKIFGFNFF